MGRTRSTRSARANRAAADAEERPAARPRRVGHPFIVLTGLSGSGKSQAIRALEDLGYFCVDNLPTTLIPTLAKLSVRAGGGIDKIAIVVDIRERGFLLSFPKVFGRLRKMPRLNPVLIFLEANHAALLRRFSETRRPHPLARGRSVAEGIRDERARLGSIRSMADEIIDTSDMTVHELRQFFMGVSRVSTLRRRTGRDQAVVDFMERDESSRAFMDRLEEYLRFAVPYYIAEGKSYLTIAIGCTGGRHRSVVIAERLRTALASLGTARVRVRHRDIGLGG
jgi:RNase adapter protein RapZ